MSRVSDGIVSVTYSTSPYIDYFAPPSQDEAIVGGGFGTSMATGDFNHDGFDDLAIAFQLFIGASKGLKPTTSLSALTYASVGTDLNQFGQAVAGGDDSIAKQTTGGICSGMPGSGYASRDTW
jgi:FG-GAP repeat